MKKLLLSLLLLLSLNAQEMDRDDLGHVMPILGKGDLTVDAWGRQKVVSDYSMFHGLFTFDVPNSMWIEYNGTVEIPKTNAVSIDGQLKVSSNGNDTFLMSKRHPRYQPNRGLLYSSSIILPNKDADATREFGIFNSQFGTFFRLEAGDLLACRRNTTTDLNTTTICEDIDDGLIPKRLNLEKGNIYDIQMQWRGVGNIKFFIGDPVTGFSKLVHEMKLLGKLNTLSIGNPALPIGYRAVKIGEDASIFSGCVDITSEGGVKENRQRGVLVSEEVSLTTGELPILLLHLPNKTVNGWMNTRDLAMRRIKAYSDENTLLRVYFTRDASAFTGTTYFSSDEQNTTVYSIDGNITYNGGARLVNQDRVPALGSISIDNPDEVYGDFYLTHGDYFMVTMQAKNNSLGGISFEWGAEI